MNIITNKDGSFDKDFMILETNHIINNISNNIIKGNTDIKARVQFYVCEKLRKLLNPYERIFHQN